MSAQPLVFRSANDGVLVAPPHCGLLTVPDFLRRVHSWCATRTAPLVVDLSEVETFDSGVLKTLVWARRHCLTRGVQLAVVEPGEGVLAPQQLVLLRKLLPLHGDRASARGATSDPALGSAAAAPLAG